MCEFEYIRTTYEYIYIYVIDRIRISAYSLYELCLSHWHAHQNSTSTPLYIGLG